MSVEERGGMPVAEVKASVRNTALKIRKWAIWALAILALGFFVYVFVQINSPAVNAGVQAGSQVRPTAQQMYNIFADVNGDGKVDFLESARVIFQSP